MRPPETDTDTLLYTDRSIYRPGQELRWKAVAYEGRGARYRTDPDAKLTVELLDSNGEAVASQAVTTNRFGSASGTFQVPPGRLLGSWMLRSSRGGQTHVQVEEYKRPTFEVTLQEPKEALRLNRPAKLPGEARYYFGLPVTAATVRWHVPRQPVYPYCGEVVRRRRQTQPQVIAAGTATGTRTAPRRRVHARGGTSARRRPRDPLPLPVTAEVTDGAADAQR